MSSPDRRQMSVTIRGDLIDRLEKEADDRIVSKALIVEKAVEAYMDALPPLDASKLPGPPAGEKRASPPTPAPLPADEA